MTPTSTHYSYITTDNELKSVLDWLKNDKLQCDRCKENKMFLIINMLASGVNITYTYWCSCNRSDDGCSNFLDGGGCGSLLLCQSCYQHVFGGC